MKLEEGMYVRTKNNGICKLYREFHEDSVDVGIGVFPEIDGFFIDKEEINYIEKKDVLKASYNIIDLIEEGDYVNGYKVLDILKGFKILVDKLELNTRDGNYYLKQFANNEIKSIVTEEVFKANEYRVEAN